MPLMNALLDDLRIPAARIVKPNPLEIGAGGLNTNNRANNHTNTAKRKGGAGKNNRGQQPVGAAAGASSHVRDDEIVSHQVFIAALNILSLLLTTAGPKLAPHTRAAGGTLVSPTCSTISITQSNQQPLREPSIQQQYVFNYTRPL